MAVKTKPKRVLEARKKLRQTRSSSTPGSVEQSAKRLKVIRAYSKTP